MELSVWSLIFEEVLQVRLDPKNPINYKQFGWGLKEFWIRRRKWFSDRSIS